MPFSQHSLRFLHDVHRKNSREWFVRHKEDYENHIKKPMQELAEALAPTMLRIDPLLIVEPRRAVCRPHRDTRFSRDKSMFKRATWLVFQRSKGMVQPVWFFEFTPDFHHYGCGQYSTPTRTMRCIRELVLAGDKRYRDAQAALDGLPRFSVEGETYKRPHYPDASEKERNWLERRGITVLHYSTAKKPLFAKNLADTVAEAFVKLAPVYQFLMHSHEKAEAENSDFYSRAMAPLTPRRTRRV
ncbi:MAG: DUF2461 domain-containing protein [Planctomycetes bacterium]|nr:DUF2461 domain-containing protein [Planctomycetota bacterium]